MTRRFSSLAMSALTLLAVILALFAAQVHAGAMAGAGEASAVAHTGHAAPEDGAAAPHHSGHAAPDRAPLHHAGLAGSCAPEGGGDCSAASTLCDFVCTGLTALPALPRLAAGAQARREPYRLPSAIQSPLAAPAVDQRPPIRATL